MAPIVIAALAAAFAIEVAGHGFMTGFRVNGVYHQGWDPVFQFNPSKAPQVAGWTTTVKDWGFVGPANYSKPDIICHRGATPAPLSVTAPAGAKIDLLWNTWPTSHKGPVITSLAACPGNCSTVDKGKLEFFNIHAGGHLHGFDQGTWVTDTLIANNFTSTVTLPSDIKSGEYVLRHEILALHIVNETQNYPQCINLNIVNGGTSSPKGTRAQDFYSPNGPGLRFNIYMPFSTYPIPGPALYTGASSRGAGSSGGAGQSTVAPLPATTLASSVLESPSMVTLQPTATDGGGEDVVVVTATKVVTVIATAA